MREIKCRGKRVGNVNNKKWVYGYIIKEPDGSYWIDHYPNGVRNTTNVHPGSVGQFIGFRDITNKDIYEGDILKDSYNRILLVEWRRCGFCFKALIETNFKYANDPAEWFESDIPYPSVIGNNSDTPELINGV